MVTDGDEKAGARNPFSIPRQGASQGSRHKDESQAYDPYQAFLEEIERLSRSVSSGQKKEARANFGIVGLLVALLGSSGYYISNAPRPQYGIEAIRQYAQEHPNAFRPDPWTNAQDRQRMEDRAKVVDQIHAQIRDDIRELRRRLNTGSVHEHNRINSLERRLEQLERAKK